MAIWKNRPLFACACVFMLSALAGFFMPSYTKLSLIAAGLAGTVILSVVAVARHRRKRALYRPVVVLFTLLCVTLSMLSSYLTFDRKQAFIASYVSREDAVSVTGTVSQQKGNSSSFSTYVLEIDEVDGKAIACKAYLTCYYAAELSEGQIITLYAPLVTAEEASGEIYTSYQLAGDGILFGILSQSPEDMTVEGESHALTYRLSNHRKQLAAKLGVYLGKDTAGIPAALLLGEKSMLDTAVKRDFSRSGVSHLLAISGLHMTVLFGSLAWLLKRLRLHPKVRAVMLGMGAFSYLFYLGFPPSATRAVVMLGFTYLSCLLSCRADPLTSLGAAGMGILLFSPTAVADVGFWLSFSSVLGILTLLPLLKSPRVSPQGVGKRLLQKLLALLKGLGAGAAAVSMSLWVLAPVMGEISLFSAPMTLILTPLMAFLLFCTPLYLLLLNTPLASLLGVLMQAVVSWTNALCRLVGNLTYAVIPLRGILIYAVAVLMLTGTLILLGVSLSKRKRWLIFSPMITGWVIIALCLGISHGQSRNTLDVNLVTPSSVAEMMVITRGQKAVVCDLSNGSGTSLRSAVRQASEGGATELSALILTHYHSAVSGNLLWVLESEIVRALWLPTPEDEDDYFIFLACKEKADLSGTPVFVYDYGEPLAVFDKAHLNVYQSTIKRSVQPVLLLTLTSPADTLTYCGGGVFESPLAQQAQDAISQSSAVFFGHHGPKIKQPYACTFSPKIRAVGFADRDVLTLLSPDCHPNAPLSVGKLSAAVSLSPRKRH